MFGWVSFHDDEMSFLLQRLSKYPMMSSHDHPEPRYDRETWHGTVLSILTGQKPYKKYASEKDISDSVSATAVGAVRVFV